MNEKRNIWHDKKSLDLLHVQAGKITLEEYIDLYGENPYTGEEMEKDYDIVIKDLKEVLYNRDSDLLTVEKEENDFWHNIYQEAMKTRNFRKSIFYNLYKIFNK